jgi:hypothetical protein
MISKIPFPSITDTPNLGSGLWLWSDAPGGEDKIVLKRIDSVVFAFFEQHGTCVAAGVWHVHSDNVPRFVEGAGSHVHYMSPQMSNEEKGERIWTYLEAECATLLLMAHYTAHELGPDFEKSLEVHRSNITSIAQELLGRIN